MHPRLTRSGNLVILGLLAIAATCAPAPQELPALESPSPTAIPTETIDWFPATETPSPAPTMEPSTTPDLHPGVGDLILQDDFFDSEVWPTTATNTTTVALANQGISLTLRERADYLLVTRTSPTIGDYYMEITASPSLCQGNDEYGLLARATPAGSQYRLALGCNGSVKVERFYNGVLSLETEVLTIGLIPSVAPSSSRLSVWASGEELRFFVNDFHLFTVRDQVLYRGNLGVFIHSRTTNALSVSFSDLSVWALEP